MYSLHTLLGRVTPGMEIKATFSQRSTELYNLPILLIKTSLEYIEVVFFFSSNACVSNKQKCIPVYRVVQSTSECTVNGVEKL